ncbi:MAG TPA: rRNA maturation RNase YbeY [Crocinitomix sp.]|nr:rRNA maturation RNase YbeY [Crocinitomix sp.]
MNEINFNFENTSFPLAQQRTDFFSLWIKHIADLHHKQIGELNYIFCSDDYILEINKQYLNHHYNTDIITFNYNKSNTLNGDIFISLDTVRENAKLYSNNDFNEELDRVVIHGVLHLIGFNDKTEEEQLEMTTQEEVALNLRDVSRETLQKNINNNKNVSRET